MRLTTNDKVVVNKLPTLCAARYHEIERRAQKLLMTFINGNRKHMVEALDEMEPRAALAVLSEMMMHGPEVRNDLNRFLKEVA